MIENQMGLSTSTESEVIMLFGKSRLNTSLTRLETGKQSTPIAFIGRLAADPETKYAEGSGTTRTRFRVLVNEEWKDRTEQVQKHVESYIV